MARIFERYPESNQKLEAFKEEATRLDVCCKQIILVAVWEMIGGGENAVKKRIRKLLKRFR